MYAQKIEGDAWAGEKLDKAKIDKMSGESHLGCWSSSTELNGNLPLQTNNWDNSTN